MEDKRREVGSKVDVLRALADALLAEDVTPETVAAALGVTQATDITQAPTRDSDAYRLTLPGLPGVVARLILAQDQSDPWARTSLTLTPTGQGADHRLPFRPADLTAVFGTGRDLPSMAGECYGSRDGDELPVFEVTNRQTFEYPGIDGRVAGVSVKSVSTPGLPPDRITELGIVSPRPPALPTPKKGLFGWLRR